MTVQQAQAAVQTAAMALTKAEQQSVLRQEEADIIAKEVGPRQDEEEELADALAMAERTAAEYAGTGSTWEVRTQETLKERQIEHARAKNELEKAKKGEENANNLVQNAIKAVEQATRTHESAVKRLAQEQQLRKTMQLEKLVRMMDDQEEAALAARGLIRGPGGVVQKGPTLQQQQDDLDGGID
jgi:hypothetical protein